MTANTAAVLRQALELAPEERVDLAAELLASVEPIEGPETVRTLWAEELKSRARDFETREDFGEDWDTTCQEVADEIARVHEARP